MRYLTTALLVAWLSASGAAATEPARHVPAGFCLIDPSKGGYRDVLWQRFSPPKGRGAALEALAIDCGSLEAADAGRPDRPKKVFMDVRSNGTDDLPRTRSAYLTELESRFSGPAMLGRDEHAVYVAQRTTAENGSISVSGASAYTMIEGTPRILNVLAFGGGDIEAEAKGLLAAAVREMQTD